MRQDYRACCRSQSLNCVPQKDNDAILTPSTTTMTSFANRVFADVIQLNDIISVRVGPNPTWLVFLREETQTPKESTVRCGCRDWNDTSHRQGWPVVLEAKRTAWNRLHWRPQRAHGLPMPCFRLLASRTKIYFRETFLLFKASQSVILSSSVLGN